MRSYKKGDLVQHREDENKINGIILESRKKERSNLRNKHVIEIVVGQVVDVMWGTGIVETDIRVEDLNLIIRAK